MKTIFIQYAYDDHEVATQLSEFLIALGYDAPLLDKLHTGKKAMLDLIEVADLTIFLFSERYVNSPARKLESAIILRELYLKNKPFILIAIDNTSLPDYFMGIPYCEISQTDLLTGNFEEITSLLSKKESEIYQAQKEEAAEKESKKEVVQRISDSPELKKVISGLRIREWLNKGIAIICYLIGIAGIFIGAKLAYSSVSTIPNDGNSYYYMYIGAKNLAIIGLLILCSRYTFNIGKIFMEEGVKQADRLHAINYGKFFLDSFQEKLTFKEMKELFKDWNMDNRPSPLNNPDPMGADLNAANINGSSETGIVDQAGKIVDLVSSFKK